MLSDLDSSIRNFRIRLPRDSCHLRGLRQCLALNQQYLAPALGALRVSYAMYLAGK